MDIGERIADWYAAGHRDLPWRRPGFPAWGTLVSEFMLQQTPVARVIPALERWLARWPTPGDLADAPPGEAVRAWERLGYPRRLAGRGVGEVARRRPAGEPALERRDDACDGGLLQHELAHEGSPRGESRAAPGQVAVSRGVPVRDALPDVHSRRLARLRS